MRRTALLAAALLALAGCGGGSAESASPSTSSAATSAAAPSPSPAPSLPSYTAAEASYLTDVSANLSQDAAYVAIRGANLVTLGHGICADYRRGVYVSDEYNNISRQLLADPQYEPEILADTRPDAAKVRAGSTAMASIGIDLAARRNLCPDVNPPN